MYILYCTEEALGSPGKHGLGVTVGAAAQSHQSITSPAGGDLSTASSLRP